ncbi:putative mitochondrial putative ubiquitin-conjugating enzyme e2 [Leptomonas pyrrhocoris]|uniref:Putative mitochondrial putative ubiquitin-conjugating enzyme e2 n=1 Tax=Leptomonas pyrrhocoris TaxID=157538 RepID=A0A0M9FR24_LEPPY|nr:putative mitochondrial putative ubiquitin-conjugating enzyme e2 [Leptomonas pyrrhocoris]XP_015652716.1 putative mitochondrial putative ubiquitin-conjugating enzyme e2 [Leptomonas pyrrhocoris]KPA74276.1 putative mitochondrial putative ubiquitin-conjugating enzyme e2 [Leptomonas pyrrhocoris]KPA74277.1 putative mitochondrial putative ubiquitin-conjugating enzyme e2 [Leptomonas pyrrhocoris]|eukprot:XP_015652715.1 putative mitochondrial putative ubiquitin-conjugating enzyme e2 [Leptomonas pyrrhocoris]
MPNPIVRLGKELKEATEHPDPDIHLELYDASHTPGSSTGTHATSQPSLYLWLAILKGPPDTPFEGGSYKLLLTIPQDYPLVPPKAAFITKVFHPNVEFNSGNVCLDILKKRWSPVWTLSSVCRAILNLLAEPESDSPFNCDAGNLLRAGDTEGYASLVRLYAITDADAPPFVD